MLIRADARCLPLRNGSVQMVCTSPPYFSLRDYGSVGQIGLEATPEAYVCSLRAVFAEVWRVLRDDGTCWINLGDSYANDTKWGGQTSGKHAASLHGKSPLIRAKRSLGLKAKDLIGIPWRVAFALQADGWYLRSDIIWHKPNPMPESVTDRPTKAHEYLFLLSKSERYYYDAEAIMEPIAESQIGRVRNDVVGGASHTERQQHSRGGVYRGPLNIGNVAGLYIQQLRLAGESSEGASSELLCDERLNLSESLGFSGPASTELKGQFQSNSIARGVHIGHIEYIQQDVSNGKRNKRSVWTIPTMPYSGAHFATFPEALIEPCILAGCPVGGLVCDPFIGSGTVGAVAERLGRRWVGTDLSYQDLAHARTAQRGLRW